MHSLHGNTTLEDYQSQIELPPTLALIRAKPDGLCFYHAVQAAMEEHGGHKGCWSISWLRERASHLADTYASDVEIRNLSTSIGMGFLLLPVRMVERPCIAWSQGVQIGPETPCIPLQCESLTHLRASR